MRSLLTAAVAAAGLMVAGPLAGTAGAAQPYSAVELLKACTEADNDARWGETAELECEQYVLGFVHALQETGDTTICVPVQNTVREVRWAYMRWVHEDYGAHKDMSAGQALMGTLRDKFKCGE